MTIKELIQIVGGNREIFIKPDGHKYYFDGMIDNIPESLMNATIHELVPQINYNEDTTNPKRYYWSLGVWVDPIREWDALVDADPEIVEWDGEYSDLMYYAIFENYYAFMEELSQTAKNRKRKNLRQFQTMRERFEKTKSDIAENAHSSNQSNSNATAE